jgi:hypothetical protein
MVAIQSQQTSNTIQLMRDRVVLITESSCNYLVITILI